MAQAVSDLSASDAPSLSLWNQLSAFYNVCEVACVTIVCLDIHKNKDKLLKTGIYLFGIMEWISAVGYRMFPLSSSGYAGTFQDVMHMVVTVLVVLLSIVSLVIIIIAGFKSKKIFVLWGLRGHRSSDDACRRFGNENCPHLLFWHR